MAPLALAGFPARTLRNAEVGGNRRRGQRGMEDAKDREKGDGALR